MKDEKSEQKGKLEKELLRIGLKTSMPQDSWGIRRYDNLASRFIEYVKSYVSRMFGRY